MTTPMKNLMRRERVFNVLGLIAGLLLCSAVVVCCVIVTVNAVYDAGSPDTAETELFAGGPVLPSGVTNVVILDDGWPEFEYKGHCYLMLAVYYGQRSYTALTRTD